MQKKQQQGISEEYKIRFKQDGISLNISLVVNYKVITRIWLKMLFVWGYLSVKDTGKKKKTNRD